MVLDAKKTARHKPMDQRLPLTENGRAVLERRYLRRGVDGNPIESPEAMFGRVAHHIALVEQEHGGNVEQQEAAFLELLTQFRFFPNSPTFTGAGTPLGQLAACFVLPINDDMGRDGAGIFQTLRDAALIQQTGGGNGFSFSRLRPQGTLVHSSAGQATGPVGFLRVYDQAFGEIAQGGVRRGANMAVLSIGHPDILGFISCKTDENAITNFNISVGISDSFMRAVENDEMWQLCFPDVQHSEYPPFQGTLNQAFKAGLPIRVYDQVPARELFRRIAEQAHHNGEPGVLFLDAMNRDNPVPHLYELEATNPCGEQALGPYENCCLGSINLARHIGHDAFDRPLVDWALLRRSIGVATRFLDNVVDANQYVPAVPQLQEAALRARRIGLGIMGLGDMMCHLNVRYGSEDAQEFAAQLMEFVRYHAMLTSIELAAERGPFPSISGSSYDPAALSWEPPRPLSPYSQDWGRPPIDWTKVTDGIAQHGIRNAAQTTIAPTGTIATVAGCEAYGCEPIFALAYVRHVNDNGHDLELAYTSPLFAAALERSGMDRSTADEIIQQVMQTGSCQEVAQVPPEVRHSFIVAGDLSIEEHVRMQAALQAFVDNSISKTINAPPSATLEDVQDAYMLAWRLGLQGADHLCNRLAGKGGVGDQRDGRQRQRPRVRRSPCGPNEKSLVHNSWPARHIESAPRRARLISPSTRTGAASPLRYSFTPPRRVRRPMQWPRPPAACFPTFCDSLPQSHRVTGFWRWCASWWGLAVVVLLVLAPTGCSRCLTALLSA